MVESVRWRRLRWRLRGAWQWPAFVVLTVARRASLVARLPFQGEGADAFGAVLRRRLLQPARGGASSRRLLGLAAAPPPARPAVHDRPRLRGHGAAGADHRGAARGRARRTARARARRARRPARGLRRRPRLRRRDRARVRRGPRRRSTRCGSSPSATAPASSARRSARSACFVNTDQSPAGVIRDPSREPNA